MCYFFHFMSRYIINADYMSTSVSISLFPKESISFDKSFSSTRFSLSLQYQLLYSKPLIRVAPCNSILGALLEPVYLKYQMQQFNLHHRLSGCCSHPYGYLLLFSAGFCSLIRSLKQNPGLLLFLAEGSDNNSDIK